MHTITKINCINPFQCDSQLIADSKAMLISYDATLMDARKCVHFHQRGQTYFSALLLLILSLWLLSRLECNSDSLARSEVGGNINHPSHINTAYSRCRALMYTDFITVVADK